MSVYTTISPDKLSKLIGTANTPALIDVRTDEDFTADPRLIPGAIRRNHEAAADWGEEFSGRPAIVICLRGQKLAQGTAAWLRHLDVPAEALEGGFEGWKAAKLPLVPAAKLPARDAKGRTVWVTRSDDDGLTWAKPVEITKDVKKPGWTWYATGPGVGIQLKSGRLLIPCDSKSDGGKVRESHVILSDDGGRSWKLGGVVGPGCNECQAVELSDGSVMLNMRTYMGNNRRLVAVSKDGGETFSPPVPDKELIEPVCQASILRLGGLSDGIAFSNPASLKREKMTVRLSKDDGKTWPVAKVLHPGPAAYSVQIPACRGGTAGADPECSV